MQSKSKPRTTNPHFSYSDLTLEACKMRLQAHLNSEADLSWRMSFDQTVLWVQNATDVLQLQLLVLCSSIAIVHFVLKRFGVSKFSSQLITGMMFGSSCKYWNRSQLIKMDSEDVLGLVAYIGYALFLFMSTVKVDVTMVVKVDRKALMIGLPTIFVPLITGFVVQTMFNDGLSKAETYMVPLMISFHSLTAFPVIASLLTELQIVNSELGRLGLSSALVIDTVSIFLVVACGQFRRFKAFPAKASVEFGILILFILIIAFVFRPAILWMIKQTPEGQPIRRSFIQCVVFWAILSILLSSFTGLPALIGPYLLGLAVPAGAPLASTLVEKIESLVSIVFMPIMVVSCALRGDLSKMSAAFDTPFTKLNVILVCVVITIKLMTCLLFSLFCKLPFREALTLALIISCKGVVELNLYATAIDRRRISERLFGFLTLTILAIATFVPIAVRFLYNPSRKYANYQHRNILHLNPNSELRVLACVHGDENIYGLVHLFNLSCPMMENPLTVYVFHLIELIGRSTPIFISHSLQTNTLDDHSYSENIILSFEQFKRNHGGSVYVECFTEISPNKLMHDDICSLALDKFTSLIILPFHRTWRADGRVIRNDHVIRTMNRSVLERAPCSVGIFVDRGNLGRVAAMGSRARAGTYSVCVIYLGGNDDQEAISYAKRMAKDSRVELTVLRLRSQEEDELSNWEKLIDSEVLKDFKTKYLEDESVKYIEEVAGDGAQTALTLGKMVNDHDLIIVGRRHGMESTQTAGLSEWNEFPELGILGDLIVSTDTNCTTSLLVIQQQVVKHS